MKKILLVLAAIICSVNIFAQHALTKVWQTDTLLKAPESVRFNPAEKIFYVSNIGDFNKQGEGFISKVGLDGKIISRDWVTGLTAPKGLGLYENLLYTAEHTAVAVIDINTGQIIKRFQVEGGQMLNDITIDAKGVVYVSDTRTNKIHKIENDSLSLYLDNMNSVNGLLAVGSDLYILTGTTLQKADTNKKLTTLADGIEGGADGIEMVKDHEFIVTGWAGTIYYVKDDGKKQLLLDTRKQQTNAADLWYDAATKMVYVPAMSKNMLVAYKLK